MDRRTDRHIDKGGDSYGTSRNKPLYHPFTKETIITIQQAGKTTGEMETPPKNKAPLELNTLSSKIKRKSLLHPVYSCLPTGWADCWRRNHRHHPVQGSYVIAAPRTTLGTYAVLVLTAQGNLMLPPSSS